MGIAGSLGKLSAFALDAEIPALLRKGATEALGGQSDPPRDMSNLRKRVVAILLRVNRIGYFILGAVNFREDASMQVRGPVVSASRLERAFTNKCPNFPDGRFHLPSTEDGLYRLEPPSHVYGLRGEYPGRSD